MSAKQFDIVILTDKRYVNPSFQNDYIRNVLLEDQLVVDALCRVGLHVFRTNWDDPDFDWTTTKAVLFRTTWDYFDRFEEFCIWLDRVKSCCRLINTSETIFWNLDKHYLFELEERGVRIPSGKYVRKGEEQSLEKLIAGTEWQKVILKPAVSGAAKNTFLFESGESSQLEAVFRELITDESMIVQEFQESIMDKGEISLILFGGRFSHAVLKIAKPGDFRVQDDHGGTVHHYKPNQEEILFAENAVRQSHLDPTYARVDIMWDNHGNLCLGELELIEPELWFRLDPLAADRLAHCVRDSL